MIKKTHAPSYQNISLYILFFCSGFCSLVYEIIWSRMFVLVMGNTIFSTSTILASFMTGLALGSIYWGYKIRRHKPLHAIKYFAILEISTGLYGLLFPLIFYLFPSLENMLTQFTSKSSHTQLFIRYLTSTSLIIIPTFMMGGTFAILSHAIIQNSTQFARKAALLYGINTIGAVTGALFTGFFLIKSLGHLNTIYLAASINIIIGMVAFAIWKTKKHQQSKTTTKTVINTKEQNKNQSINIPVKYKYPIFYVIFISGLCSLSYQIIWTRLLILVIDNSVYSFTMILAIFLVGISLGSFLISLPNIKPDKTLMVFGWINISIAISSFCVPFFINIKSIPGTTTYWYFLISTIPLFIIIPTIFMGMAVPVAMNLYNCLSKNKAGDAVGKIFGINTIGSVTGILLSTFCLIPMLGIKNSLTALYISNFSAGYLIIFLTTNKKYYKTAHVFIFILIIITMLFIPPDNFFEKKYSNLEPQSQLIYYKEETASTITIFQRPDKHRVLYINGIPEVDTTFLSVQTLKLLGVISGALSRNNQNALIITFGAGITANAATLFADRVDCVDLVKHTKPISKFFSFENDNIIEKNNISFHVDDARHYLLSNDKQYSFIISDATHPRSYDSWVLYTKEFYQLVKTRLDKEGIFCQWLPFHGINEAQFLSIIKTFKSVFKETSLWRIDNGYVILLSTPSPFEIDFIHLFNILQQNRNQLIATGLDNPIKMLTSFSMASKQIDKMVKNGKIISDNSPVHLFFPFDGTFEEQYSEWPENNYKIVKQYEESIIPYLTFPNISDINKIDQIKEIIKKAEL
ncbi:membrane hypothetical protein [Desulfamplus magnetovallimortis]|uniref:PABS domain-containing protein n=1 Tax=Desulfamplus magnetovallimortis TaxID=1246637 RepID=A0A1W1HIH6_9BACT|nr:fused MFS/spermidine synthase [Desulfamplus magnetovallimortis]SLM32178.1 membrane hypothetical protein [Desulfamplus magnetovallimortis]